MKGAIRNIAVSALAISLLMCTAGGRVVLTDPVDDNVLIIGNIIFENDNWQDRKDIFKDRIEVALIGSVIKNGKEETVGFWTETDENGFFFYPNAPNGKYELKAIRFYMPGGLYFGLIKEFRATSENYQRIGNPQNIMFTGSMFNKEAVNKIVNLKFNYFSIFPNGEIQHGYYDQIKDLTMSTGEVLNTPLIYEYFLNKPEFANSGWLPLLDAELQKYKDN